MKINEDKERGSERGERGRDAERELELDSVLHGVITGIISGTKILNFKSVYIMYMLWCEII